jgi:hypothetical protein
VDCDGLGHDDTWVTIDDSELDNGVITVTEACGSCGMIRETTAAAADTIAGTVHAIGDAVSSLYEQEWRAHNSEEE